MNSERRHELQQNDLADMLGGQIKKVEPYAKLIVVAVALVVFAAFAIGVYRNAELTTRSNATYEMLKNSGTGDPGAVEALGGVGTAYSDTAAGSLAKVFQADALLTTGISSLFNDREEAKTQLADALRLYTEVADTSKETLVSSRAHFGMARTYESMGETEKAVSAYNRVVDIRESEAMVTAAKHRIEHLKSPITEEFFAWFNKQDFRPADPSVPPTLPGGASLPDLPNLELPDLSPLKVPAELKGDPTSGDQSTEAPGEMALPKSESPTAAPAADSPAPPAEPQAPPAEPQAPSDTPELNPPATADSPAADAPAADATIGGSEAPE